MKPIERYIECPSQVIPPSKAEAIYIGGEISRTENWQARACEVLHNSSELYIFNPRNNATKISDEEQILWEKERLDQATQILFWFTSETTQPSVLFYLGTRIQGRVPIFIGAHPRYPFRRELSLMVKLFGDGDILDNLEDLLRVVSNYNKLLKISI